MLALSSGGGSHLNSVLDKRLLLCLAVLDLLQSSPIGTFTGLEGICIIFVARFDLCLSLLDVVEYVDCQGSK